MKNPKIGLALGGGAAKGLAHIGVLKAFEEGGIPIHAIAGSSIGAVVGGCYAAGVGVSGLTEFALKFGRRSKALWMDPSFFFKGGGILKGDKIEDALRELTGHKKFSDLKIPFFAVATDLITGKEVVLKNGDLHAAIHASFSIPGIFSPVRIGDHLLVDGGVVAPIPTRILKENGCDIIVGVNVATGARVESSIATAGTPGILDVLIQVLSVTQSKMAFHCMELADIHIIPDTADQSWTDFSKHKELIELGYKAAKHHMPVIKAMIASTKFTSFFKRLFKSY